MSCFKKKKRRRSKSEGRKEGRKEKKENVPCSCFIWVTVITWKIVPEKVSRSNRDLRTFLQAPSQKNQIGLGQAKGRRFIGAPSSSRYISWRKVSLNENRRKKETRKNFFEECAIGFHDDRTESYVRTVDLYRVIIALLTKFRVNIEGRTISPKI